MSSRSVKTATKSKKSACSPRELGIPKWLQEETGTQEKISDSVDPWLSGSGVSAPVAAPSSNDAGVLLGMSNSPTQCKHSVVGSLKRPRTSSANSISTRAAAAEVLMDDGSSHSSKDDTSATESTIHTSATPQMITPARMAPLSSDSGEDVIIDDCTFSDDGDCVVLENTPVTAPTSKSPCPNTNKMSAPVTPPNLSSMAATSGESVTHGLSEVIPVDDDTVLITTAPQFCLLLWGAYQVRVLCGAVHLHGATLTPARDGFLPVFALRVKALPPMCPAEVSPESGSEDQLSSLPEQVVAAVRRTTGCALLLRRLPSRLLTLLAAQLGDTFTPPGGGDDVIMSRTGCRLLRDAAKLRSLQLNLHVSSAQWDERLKQLMAVSASEERLRVVFAGGKGVGKSTWMYYVLNMLLNTWRHVYVLDVDPGQAEFTPCACLSLVKIDSFLVGPSFTHLREPVRSVFIGEVSIANDPFGYMDAVQQLVTAYRGLAETDPAPLLVNTMGWAKGLGEDLLLEVLALTQPSDLLEIVHPTKQQVNFARPLTSERVNGAGRSWLMRRYLRPGAPGRPPVSYRHSRLTSPGLEADTCRQTSSALAPWMYRQLNTTACVTSLEKDDRTLCQLTPVCVPWSRLAVHLTTRQVLPQHMMHAINGTVVALCWTDPAGWIPPDDRSLFSLLPQLYGRPPCVGFGLVRGVDAGRRLLYLLTALTAEQLDSANTVIRGPHHLLDVFPASSGVRSWTPALTEDTPAAPPLHRPNKRHKVARAGTPHSRGAARTYS